MAHSLQLLANGDGPAFGAGSLSLLLFQFIHSSQKISAPVWLTADVHYAAAHYYDPTKAQFITLSLLGICMDP